MQLKDLPTSDAEILCNETWKMENKKDVKALCDIQWCTTKVVSKENHK